MKKIMKDDEQSQSKDIVADNIDKLKALFPEVITEGDVDGKPQKKIDFEALKEVLGDYVEDKEERYNFTWHGKANARRLAQTPSAGTLRPCKEESVDWDTTQNLFIEGDNLEVLKLLQKSYHKKVKMIYIDPPYNTGKEFIYPDKYQDNLDTYLKYTGQIDDEGFKISANTETTGRYHTNWLNMMYPRLKLARNLLKDDGVVFISIDDNEQSNLRGICDEVFGEDNLIGSFIWKRRASSAMADNNISTDHEYVICYQKGEVKEFIGFEKDFKSYSNPDGDERGPWVLGDLTVGMTASMRPNQAYDLKDHLTGNLFSFNPNRVWAYIPESMDKLIREKRIFFPSDQDKRPMLKRFQNELKSTHNPISTLLLKKVGLNTEGTKNIQELFGGNVFDYSKPLSLLNTLIPQVCLISSDDIVLDFFSGSSVTANSVIDLNSSDGSKRKFIMVQLPELCDEKSEAFKAGFKTISDIGKERIRRAANKIKQENPEYKGDLGFKVLKLDATNIVPWEADFDNLEKVLEFSDQSIKADRSAEDVLYEILLKYGLDLTLPIKEHTIANKTIFDVGMGALLVCLDDEIPLEVAEGISKLKEELQPEVMRVVFKDAGFANDVVKTNTLQVLKQFGIDDVKSI